MTRYLVVVLVLSSACTKRANECGADSDCKVPYPFCDVDGAYPASGGVTNVCTVVPDNCPAERCGCTPNATTCANQTLSVCNPDGRSATTTACDLGCSADNTRCASFAPSNGLADALAMAKDEPDIDFPPMVDVFDNGDILELPSNAHVVVRSLLVTQVGVPSLRVFIARSFKIHAGFIQAIARDTSNPIAFVASGSSAIDGAVDAGFPMRLVYFGPGSQLASAPCAGVAELHGGGGGGNATPGGYGAPKAQLPAAPGAPGGAAQPANLFEPLVGGCPGGGFNGNPGGNGGAGLEFVSRSSINISGILNAGGLGGGDSSGGGSGGNILLEAPRVSISGTVAANGGSGGACGIGGNPGSSDAAPAAGVGGCGTNSPTLSGSGGTETQGPGIGVDTMIDTAAGGGGAVGRLQVKTTDGTYSHSGAVLSIHVSTGILVPR